MTAAARFAAHAIDTRFADLPAAAVHKTRIFVLDSLGVGIAGSSVDGAEGLLRVAAGWGAPAVPAVGPAGPAVRAGRRFRQRLADAQSGI